MWPASWRRCVTWPGAKGLVQDRPIESFWKSFLDTVKLTGRSFEIGVMADYMMRTGRGWGNMDMAPAALLKGKLPFLPTASGP